MGGLLVLMKRPHHGLSFDWGRPGIGEGHE
jgi:hypothetical protein